MTDMLPALLWVQPLLLAALMFGGLALRRWGKGRAPAIGMALLWLGVVIAVAWFAWSLTAALQLMQAG